MPASGQVVELDKLGTGRHNAAIAAEHSEHDPGLQSLGKVVLRQRGHSPKLVCVRHVVAAAIHECIYDQIQGIVRRW